METSEIRTLIEKKIAGQGTAVDAASALPAILNGILEKLESISPLPPVVINTSEGFLNLTPAQIVDLNIGFETEEEVEDFYKKGVKAKISMLELSRAGDIDYLVFGGVLVTGERIKFAFINTGGGDTDPLSIVQQAIFSDNLDGTYSYYFNEI